MTVSLSDLITFFYRNEQSVWISGQESELSYLIIIINTAKHKKSLKVKHTTDKISYIYYIYVAVLPCEIYTF
jgi:hypothetical protein